LSNDYRPNITVVADGASKTTNQLINVFNGSDQVTATVMADNTNVIFNHPAPSLNYVQYEGVTLSGQTNDSVSLYFLLRPSLVPSATVRCRIITNTPAATAAATLVPNQSITVNALTRTDMLVVSNQIAALGANQSIQFARPVELIALGVTGTGIVVTLPVITNIQVSNVTDSAATIQWTTDVPADSRVLYGLTPSSVTNVVSVAGNVTSHSVTLTALQDGTTYYFDVSSTSPSGTTTDDNQEAHYTFTTLPRFSVTAATTVSEGCAPTNGVVDPGESATVSFSLQNNGTVDTVNLVATLLATNGVTVPSSPQSYGVLVAGGAAVARSFTFTADGTCGGNIAATLQLQDGSTNLGTTTVTLPLGQIANPLVEAFDSVTAPALPAGWSTSASGAASNWVTSTVSTDSPPNAAFTPDPGTNGVNELDTPSVSITSALSTLTFRQNYSLAGSFTNSTLGYDGGVLDIKIGSGSYTDIIAAGGSFVSGGYTTTLSTSNGNPLVGRQAWSRKSGGFITTMVTLPATHE